MSPIPPHLRPCPCCGGRRAPWGPLPPDRLAPGALPVSLVRCLVCGTLETVLPGEEAGRDAGVGAGGRAAEPSESPVGEQAPESPETGPGAYLPHAEPGGLTGWLAERSRMRKTELAARWSVSTASRLVDVGCGSGGFLAACRRRWPHRELLGTEPDAGAAAAASRRGFRVLSASLEDPMPEPVRDAGVYTLWHVLEHLRDPGGALLHLRGGLAPEGRILLALPNARAWERRLWGRHTLSWDPPRHRWHLTPQGLEGLVRSAGLEVAGRFSLISDDVYDAAGSLRWLLYSRAWTDARSVRGRAAMAAGLAAAPMGLLLGLAAPRDARASLGYVLVRG